MAADTNCTIIPPTEYPALPATNVLTRLLHSPPVIQATERVLASSEALFRDAVLAAIGRLVAAAPIGDAAAIYQEAHEIRGLAGNAGLAAAAAIANGLCGYLDAVVCTGQQADDIVTRLHIEAIGRAATASDETTRLGTTVANDLARLVAKKLAGINPSETNHNSCTT